MPEGVPAEEMEVLAEEFPDLAMIACEQRLQWNPLRVQHARDVVVGDDEEFGGRAEGCVRVGEEARVNVTVRRDDGKFRDGLIEVARDITCGGVG